MSQGYKIVSASVSDRGLSDKRPQNEDSFLDIPQKGIFAVADGVGGAQAGEVASQMAVEILAEAFTNMLPGSDAEQVMHLALVQANSAINQMSSELPQLSQMATTIVVLHLDGNIVTIGHAGDSRLYRLDPKGMLHRETDDHSMVAEEVRAGRMTEEQAENHPAKNIISRALGAEPNIEVELKTKIVDGRCIYLLCSDGITRHIPDAELAAILAENDPEQACAQMKRLCYARGAEDNLTAVVVHYETDAAESRDTAEAMIDTLRGSDPHTANDEDDTVATARPAAEPHQPAAADELIEIDTVSLTRQQMPDLAGSDLVILDDDNNDGPITEPAPTPLETRAPVQEPIAPTVFAGASADEQHEHETRSGSNVLAASIGSLILGALIGLAVYHFALLPQTAPAAPALDDMRSKNVPETTFEESRRLVDKDPTLYLQRMGTVDDAEGFYLAGRAHLLLGDAAAAKKEFAESRSRLSSISDRSNSKVIATDIAIMMTAIRDTASEADLKKELAAPAPNEPANTANASNAVSEQPVR